MKYAIKPKPTTYAGVNFRSRLEAQWAAMFDLLGIKWEYEPPVDFDGWLPDFRLSTDVTEVFAEVKPTPFGDYSDGAFDKARSRWRSTHIMLLASVPGDWTLGCLMDTPDDASYAWSDVNEGLGWGATRAETKSAWRQAGNVVRT